MIRRGLAAIVLVPSLLLGTAAWTGFVALRTIFDPGRSQQVAEDLIDDEVVVGQLTDELSETIVSRAPPEAGVTPEQADEIATAVLDDPATRGVLLDSLRSAHGAFLGEGDAPSTVALDPVVAQLTERVAAFSPEAAQVIAQAGPVEVELPTDWIPDASPVRDALQTGVPILASASAFGFVIALLTTSHRPAILRRAGLWAIGLAAGTIVLGVGVPALLELLAPPGTAVLAALASALARAVIGPALVMAGLGALALVASFAWPSPRRWPAGEHDPASVPVSARPSGGGAHHYHHPAGWAPGSEPAPAPQPHAAGWGGPAEPTITMDPIRVSPASGAPGGSAGSQSRPIAPAGWSSSPSAQPAESGGPRLPPRWVQGHGWVMDPRDPGRPPRDARWVAGVGYVLADQAPPPGS